MQLLKDMTRTDGHVNPLTKRKKREKQQRTQKEVRQVDKDLNLARTNDTTQKVLIAIKTSCECGVQTMALNRFEYKAAKKFEE